MNKNRGDKKTDCTREPLFVDIVEDEVEEVKVLPKVRERGIRNILIICWFVFVIFRSSEWVDCEIRVSEHKYDSFP